MPNPRRSAATTYTDTSSIKMDPATAAAFAQADSGNVAGMQVEKPQASRQRKKPPPPLKLDNIKVRDFAKTRLADKRKTDEQPAREKPASKQSVPKQPVPKRLDPSVSRYPPTNNRPKQSSWVNDNLGQLSPVSPIYVRLSGLGKGKSSATLVDPPNPFIKRKAQPTPPLRPNHSTPPPPPPAAAAADAAATIPARLTSPSHFEDFAEGGRDITEIPRLASPYPDHIQAGRITDQQTDSLENFMREEEAMPGHQFLNKVSGLQQSLWEKLARAFERPAGGDLEMQRPQPHGRISRPGGNLKDQAPTVTIENPHQLTKGWWRLQFRRMVFGKDDDVEVHFKKSWPTWFVRTMLATLIFTDLFFFSAYIATQAEAKKVDD